MKPSDTCPRARWSCSAFPRSWRACRLRSSTTAPGPISAGFPRMHPSSPMAISRRAASNGWASCGSPRSRSTTPFQLVASSSTMDGRGSRTRPTPARPPPSGRRPGPAPCWAPSSSNARSPTGWTSSPRWPGTSRPAGSSGSWTSCLPTSLSGSSTSRRLSSKKRRRNSRASTAPPASSCWSRARPTRCDAVPCLLALDQGTTSSRAIVFTDSGAIAGLAQQEVTQFFPGPGLVEHDPEEIWESQLATARRAMAEARVRVEDIGAVGIANQRETVVLWERATGRPLHRAIVWQDRRTADHLADLREAGHEATVRERTGLLLDPYFSASKIAWLLDHVPHARARAAAGELAAGTIDAWLVNRLTAGARHLTDVTNASRTLLFDIHRGRWDPALLDLFHIPPEVLPEVCPSSGPIAETDRALFGRPLPIAGVAG